MMTKKQRDKFEELARPLIKYLNDNFHPHATIIITPRDAEIVIGECAFQTEDYIKD